MTAKKPSDDRPTDEKSPLTKNARSQGIVRDQRGQEQPADKERAQRTSQSDKPAAG